MKNGKCTKPKRLLSIFLAVLVAVSILPMSWLQASAATEKHPDAVTITVTDGKGKALADAVVNYTIVSQTDVENLISGTVMTDEDGCAEVLFVDGYKENDLELTAQVSKEHYESNDTTIVSLPITSADQNFAVSLRCMLIENVTVTGVTEAYADGKKFPAATVEGIVTDGKHPDKVTYELSTYEKDETTGKEQWVSVGTTSELPQISEVGKYKLAVSVDRGEQYEIYRTEVTSEITLGKITDYTITPLNGTYTGAEEEQELPKYDAVTVTGGRENDKVTYQLGNGEKTKAIPQIQYAGTYSVTVRVERENYEPFKQTYTAVLKSKANEYKDTCSENNNYIKKTRKTQLDIVQTDDLLRFEENGNIVVSKEYVFGTNNGIISNLQAWKAKKDNGTITYNATVMEEDSENYGISIEQESGELSISNYKKLAEKLVDNDGTLTVKVAAHKTAGTNWVRKGFGHWEQKELYAKANANYTINIQFEATPENSFFLKSSGKADAETVTANEAGWFQQAVYVVPAVGYQIASEWKNDAAKTLNAMSSVVFNDQGERERIVYLKNATTGGITAPIKTGIEKIDSVRPDAKDIEVTYSTSTPKLLDKIFHFYDKTGVTVTITAKDATSGIKALNWIYTRAAEASDSNLEQASGTLTDIKEVETNGDKKVYQATLQLPDAAEDQLNGNLQVQAVDVADLSSDYMTDTDNIVVVDSISPKLDVSYSFENATERYQKLEEVVNGETVNHHYTSDDVTVTLKVKEANFYPEDVKITVNKTDV